MIEGVTNADAIPVLERLMQFAGARHRVITNNIANIDTPGFRATDLSVDAFQARLREAIDQRRQEHGNAGGRLTVDDSAGITVSRGRVEVDPQPAGDNILFHDQNDRDLERSMQALVENFTVFRTAAQLLRSRMEIVNTAIRERI